jgi:hypothetical protein
MEIYSLLVSNLTPKKRLHHPPKAQWEVLQSLPVTITHIFLSLVSFDDLPAQGVKQEIKIFLSIARSLSFKWERRVMNGGGERPCWSEKIKSWKKRK